jgi:putative transposase
LLQNHCRDLRPGYDHLLRNLKVAQAVIASQSPTFRRCYGAEFTAKKVRASIGAVGAKAAFIAPGSPRENGYCESFNARFRDELLTGEVFIAFREAQILIDRWRCHYDTVRPHSALGCRPPAPKSIVPIDQRPTMH